MSFSTSKFHWMLHFGDYADRFKNLISCWPLERKHKTPKEYGCDVRNTRTYEKTILHEVVCDHIATLLNPDTFNFVRVGLHKPQNATKNVLAWLAELLEVPAHAIVCKMARSARHSETVVCSIGLEGEADSDNAAWANTCSCSFVEKAQGVGLATDFPPRPANDYGRVW